MPSIRNSEGKLLDARPDRPDLRDRIYQPRLVTPPSIFPEPDLIKQYLTAYTDEYGLILDQGTEGACTGFGLAAVTNYLFFHQAKVREAAGRKSRRDHARQPLDALFTGAALRRMARRGLRRIELPRRHERLVSPRRLPGRLVASAARHIAAQVATQDTKDIG